MKKYIHIRSKIPAKVSINGDKTYDANLDILCNNNIYIAFFPNTFEKYLPCTISIQGNCYPNSITKIPYKNNHYEIIYNPSQIPNKQQETIILNKKYNDYIFSISNSNKSYITIISSNFSHSSTTDKITAVDFKSIDGVAIIDGIIDNDKKYLLIFNTKTKKVLIENIFNKIEKTKNGIKALKHENSILGYGMVYEFNNITKKVDSYSVYTTQVSNAIQDELIPMMFLECIKYKDYKNAKNYLENTSVAESHLKDFFGNINNIYFNGYSSDINYTIETNDGFKNFSFEIADNKIADIEENQLNYI